MPKTNNFLHINHRGSPTMTLLFELVVLDVLNVPNVLNVLNRVCKIIRTFHLLSYVHNFVTN